MNFSKSNDNLLARPPIDGSNKSRENTSVGLLLDLAMAALIVFGPFIASWAFYFFTGKPLEF